MLTCINSSLKKLSTKTTQKTTQIKLNNDQIKIIEILKENPKITRNELADNLNLYLLYT